MVAGQLLPALPPAAVVAVEPNSCCPALGMPTLPRRAHGICAEQPRIANPCPALQPTPHGECALPPDFSLSQPKPTSHLFVTPTEDHPPTLLVTLQHILHGEFDFPPDVPLSPECKDLIQRILVRDPAQRITLQQVRMLATCGGGRSAVWLLSIQRIRCTWPTPRSASRCSRCAICELP